MIFAAAVVKSQGFRVFSKASEERSKQLPNDARGRRKWLPGAPREGQARAPRERQERPRATQERPESRPRGQKKEQLRSPLPFALSGGHLGAILERFGSPQGNIFKPFSLHFAMLEAMR